METRQELNPNARQVETHDMPRPAALSPTQAPGRPRLTLVHSNDEAAIGQVVPITGELLLLGRDVDGPSFTIHDAHASRLHARCVWDGRMRSLRIQDAASRNGTFVNGQRTESVLLSHGDVIRVGDSLFVYQEDALDSPLSARARSLACSDLTVLIQGETGSGKEHLARSLHAEGGEGRPFVPVACGALPHDHVAQELFGSIERDATGRERATSGLIERAAGGTLLLDEIGESSLEVQRALMRFLEDRQIRPVGSAREIPVQVRVMATAQKDLREAAAAGSFPGDLFARLGQAVLRVPPLRERRHELLGLARAFAAEEGQTLTLHADAAEALLLWQWPFNLRELQSVVRACLVVHGERASMDLPYLAEFHPELVHSIQSRVEAQLRDDPRPQSTQGRLQRDRKRLRGLLEEHSGNVSQVAKELGKPRAQIYRWMGALGLSAKQFRS